jgi:Na+-transporting NADH:ubiquinone oxidoreductase subunit C
VSSVKYVIGFCVAICLVCSIFVSTAAVSLKPLQDINAKLDRQMKVLTVAGVDVPEGSTADQVQGIFDARIRSIVVDLDGGTIDEAVDAASFDQRKATKDPATSAKAPDNRAGISRRPNHALVYQVSATEMGADGGGFALDSWIFPIEGKGLWSTLYGFIALAPDMNQVQGITYFKHGETPGLGGEVDNPTWKGKWPGRLVYGPKGSDAGSWTEVKLGVIKGMAGKPGVAPHDVDGLSGATLTSNGVTNMLKFWLGEHGFGPFIQNTLAKGGAA